MIVSIGLALFVLFFLAKWLVGRIPEGWEDAAGFHEGTPPPGTRIL